MSVSVSASASESVTAKDVYSSVYPFNDLDNEEQRRWMDILLRAGALQSQLVRMGGEPSPMLNTSIYALRVAMDVCALDPRREHFVDCMSSGGVLSLAASLCGFAQVTAIEISKQSLFLAKTLSKEREALSAVRGKVSLLCGSVQDYLPVEGSVLFLDTSLLDPQDGLLDEGTLVQTLFDTSRIVLAGSTLIVLTHWLRLDEQGLRRIGMAQRMRCIHSLSQPGEVPINIWILRKI